MFYFGAHKKTFLSLSYKRSLKIQILAAAISSVEEMHVISKAVLSR